MSPISFVRISAFAATICAAVASQSIAHFVELVSIVAIAHYAVAIFYSRQQIKNAFSNPISGGLTVWLAFGSLVLAVTRAIKLVVLFLPHHVFNEVYLTRKELFHGREKEVRGFILSALLFNTALYLAVMPMKGWNPVIFGCDAIQMLLLVSGAWFAGGLFRMRDKWPLGTLLDACTLELLTIVALIIGRYTSIQIWHIVFYHVAMWGLYPLTKLWKPGQLSPAFKYIAINALILGGIGSLSPSLNLPVHLTPMAMYLAFAFFSIFHIMISVALSKAQPEWIWSIFQPSMLPSGSGPQSAPSTTEKVPVLAGR